MSILRSTSASPPMLGSQRRCGPRTVQLDIQTQLVRRIGVADRFFVRNVAIVIELEQGPIEGPHAQLPRFRHDYLYLVKLALENFFGNDGRIDQYLHGSLASDRKSVV